MSWQNPGLPGAATLSGLATESTLDAVAGFVTDPYDTVQITTYLDATDNYPTIIVFRFGGAAGTIVATLTLSYDGSSRLTQVVKT